MFSMHGTLKAAETVATLSWRDGEFFGDPEAMSAVVDLIWMREIVRATPEGPSFEASAETLEAAIPTAHAVFERVEFVVDDEPDWPEYDGGVVESGPDLEYEEARLQESVRGLYTEAKHPRDRLGRWIVVATEVGRARELRGLPGQGTKHTRTTAPVEGEAGHRDALLTQAEEVFRGNEAAHRMDDNAMLSMYDSFTAKRLHDLTSAANGNKVALRLRGWRLRAMLDEGSLRNAHHGTTGGHEHDRSEGYLPARGDYERRTFGITSDDPDAYPIYGYVSRNDEDMSASRAFGEVKLTLKDEVRSRTTVIYSDSMFVGGVEGGAAVPVPIDDPNELAVASWMNLRGVEMSVMRKGDAQRPYPEMAQREYAAWLKSHPKPMGDAEWWEYTVAEKRRDIGEKHGWDPWLHGDFIEAQIHGGVSWADVERVDFETEPARDITDRLDALGIPWTVGGPGGVQEGLYDPMKHPRDRLGRWIKVLRLDSVTPHTEARSKKNIDVPYRDLAPSGKAQETVEGALRAISAAHEPPTIFRAERVPIIVDRAKIEEATYATEAMGESGYFKPAYIRMNPDASKLAVVHEIGHYLDHIYFGRQNPKYEGDLMEVEGEYFGSMHAVDHPEHALHELVNMVHESATVQRIYASMDDKEPKTMDADGEVITAAPADFFMYGFYLLYPWELFARAYAQWVATQSRDPDMLAEVERHLRPGNAYPLSWPEDEFVPIAAEFERLFAKLAQDVS